MRRWLKWALIIIMIWFIFKIVDDPAGAAGDWNDLLAAGHRLGDGLASFLRATMAM